MEEIKEPNLQWEHLCCLLIDVRTPSLSSSLGSASSLIYQLAVAVCSEGFANPCRIITGLPRNGAPGEDVIGLWSGSGGDSLPGIDSFSRGGDEQFVLRHSAHFWTKPQRRFLKFRQKENNSISGRTSPDLQFALPHNDHWDITTSLWPLDLQLFAACGN